MNTSLSIPWYIKDGNGDIFYSHAWMIGRKFVEEKYLI